MSANVKQARDEYLAAGRAYYEASEGISEGNVLLAGARMRLAAKVYARAQAEVERAMRREAPTLTPRAIELEAMRSLPMVDVGQSDAEEDRRERA